ncbi:MAG: hypothetical protein ACFFCI_02510 [Promethearchaeota archaeon]
MPTIPKKKTRIGIINNRARPVKNNIDPKPKRPKNPEKNDTIPKVNVIEP